MFDGFSLVYFSPVNLKCSKWSPSSRLALGFEDLGCLMFFWQTSFFTSPCCGRELLLRVCPSRETACLIFCLLYQDNVLCFLPVKERLTAGFLHLWFRKGHCFLIILPNVNPYHILSILCDMIILASCLLWRAWRFPSGLLQVGEVLRSPFMKFVNYICSYTAFLVLLFLATTLNSSATGDLFSGTRGVVNSLIIFYVLGTSAIRV